MHQRRCASNTNEIMAPHNGLALGTASIIQGLCVAAVGVCAATSINTYHRSIVPILVTRTWCWCLNSIYHAPHILKETRHSPAKACNRYAGRPQYAVRHWRHGMSHTAAAVHSQPTGWGYGGHTLTPQQARAGVNFHGTNKKGAWLRKGPNSWAGT